MSLYIYVIKTYKSSVLTLIQIRDGVRGAGRTWKLKDCISLHKLLEKTLSDHDAALSKCFAFAISWCSDSWYQYIMHVILILLEDKKSIHIIFLQSEWVLNYISHSLCFSLWSIYLCGLKSHTLYVKLLNYRNWVFLFCSCSLIFS